MSINNTTMAKKLLILFVLCGLSRPLDSYVYGYTRLYRPDINMTVDVVYDIHISTRNLSTNDMQFGLCDEIKGGLYPSEAALVGVLESLNRTHAHDVTLVWESWGDKADQRPAYIHLLTYPERLVEHRLRNLRFIHADTWRSEYPGTISALLSGSSLGARLNRQAIIARSGYAVWEAFNRFADETNRAVVNHYRPFKEVIRGSRVGDWTWEVMFFAKKPYCDIADVEMLSHILSSQHSRVVLFAGGAHGARIVEFLRNKTPFTQVFSEVSRHVGSGRDELDPQLLKRIAQDHVSRRPQQRTTPQHTYARAHSSSPTFRPEKVASSSIAPVFTQKNITYGGALGLGILLAMTYDEKKRTPDVPFGTIFQNKLYTTAKYSALPGLALYLFVQSAK